MRVQVLEPEHRRGDAAVHPVQPGRGDVRFLAGVAKRICQTGNDGVACIRCREQRYSRVYQWFRRVVRKGAAVDVLSYVHACVRCR